MWGAAALGIGLLWVAGTAGAQPLGRLAELSLEELMEIQVTSAARKGQPLAAVAAPVTVITGEEIRRSGATTLAEALRLAPGVHAARINADTWAVSARGFDSRFANKLLVMVDGRTAYSPLFSGTFWDVQDTLLADVDRIEVIRGPAAAMWGANGVNGVIHVVTKSARRTEGSYARWGVGTEERAFGGVRVGGGTRGGTYWRAYAKAFGRDGGAAPTEGREDADRWSQVRAGFRTDRDSGSVSVTWSGEVYTGTTGAAYATPLPDPPFEAVAAERVRVAGGHLLGRWEGASGPNAQLAVQAYYDRTERDDPRLGAGASVDTVDLELQHRFQGLPRQDWLWGGGYRLIHRRVEPTFLGSLDPSSRFVHLATGFLQDEIAVVPSRLHLILGARLEHNSYTGVELQPDARLLWTPRRDHTVWAAVSRAVRTPSAFETDGRVRGSTVPPGAVENPSPFPAQPIAVKNEDFEAETGVTWQLGYRGQPSPAVALELAAFSTRWSDLRTFESTDVSVEDGVAVVHGRVDNRMDGWSYGVEAWAEWRPTASWRLRGTYTFVRVDLEPEAGSSDGVSERDEDKTPRHQVQLHSFADLTDRLSLDVGVRYVDEIPRGGVNPYLGLDVRLGWRPLANLELALVGRNLLESRHREFPVEEFIRLAATEVERDFYATCTWSF
ncbi:MAG: TonB-dependent receptor plug domain-containing protein [Deferrisomatales bacterium]